MKSVRSALDRADIDEATYLLATISAPLLSIYHASVARQEREFEEAQLQQEGTFEAAKLQQVLDYERAVQKQKDSFASALLRYEETNHKIMQGKRVALILGGVAGVVAVLAYVLAWHSYMVPISAILAVLLILLGWRYPSPSEPVAPAPLAVPDPLLPPPPLQPPAAIPLPDLPSLARAYWQLTAAPFRQGEWILIDPQMTQPVTVELLETTLPDAGRWTTDPADRSEAEIVREMHNLDQSLTAGHKLYELYLLATDSPLAPAIGELLNQSTLVPEPTPVDAPILPGNSTAHPEAMQRALVSAANFAERPCGLDQDAMQGWLKDALDWSDRAVASANERGKVEVPENAPLHNFGTTAKTGQEEAAQACKRIFAHLLADLQVEVDAQIQQADQEREAEGSATDKRFENDRRKAEEDLQSILQRVDQQIGDLDRRRQAIVTDREQGEADLQRVTQEETNLTERLAKARTAMQATTAEATRLESERSKADSSLQKLITAIKSGRAQILADEPRLKTTTTNLAGLREQISFVEKAQPQRQANQKGAATQLTAAERNLQAVSNTSGIPMPVVEAARQGVASAKTAVDQAEQATRTGADELRLLQASASALQREIATLNERATHLRSQEEEEQRLSRRIEEYTHSIASQEPTVQTQKDEVERLQRQQDLATEEGEAGRLRQKVSEYQQQIAALDTSLAEANQEKEQRQKQVSERLAELEKLQGVERKQSDDRHAQRLAQLTQHIKTLLQQQDDWLKESVTLGKPLPASGPVAALLAYRWEALQYHKQHIESAVDNVRRWISKTRQEVNRLLWPIASPSTTAVEITFPVWFAKSGNEQSWQIVAVGPTYHVQPVTANQHVNAQQLAAVQPWLDYLAGNRLATQHTALLDQYILTFDGKTLPEQARLLADQRLIDDAMCDYLTQALKIGSRATASSQ